MVRISGSVTAPRTHVPGIARAAVPVLPVLPVLAVLAGHRDHGTSATAAAPAFVPLWRCASLATTLTSVVAVSSDASGHAGAHRRVDASVPPGRFPGHRRQSIVLAPRAPPMTM